MTRNSRKSAVSISTRTGLRLDVWLLQHLQVALSSLGRLSRSPVSSLMTTAVIGIALALPTGLHLLLANVQELSRNWDGAATISLFTRAETDQQQITRLKSRLAASHNIDQVQLISREQALQEFRQFSGFSGALDALQENPLPAVLVVTPSPEHSAPEAAERLLEQLRKQPAVEFAQLDLQWVQRFHGITEIARRAVLLFISLIGIAVLLIVVNTIRLEIQNRHPEIEICKLIGATDGFIRRPFLYSGVWYGLFGGLFAWLLVAISLWLMDAPVARLAGLYNSNFNLHGMDFTSLSLLLGGSTMLGLAGSWLAVGRHLTAIEPE